jgi:hypothetical protein
MYNVTTYPTMGYVVMLHGVSCYITVLQQCKCNIKFYYNYLRSTNAPEVIKIAISELATHATLFSVR